MPNKDSTCVLSVETANLSGSGLKPSLTGGVPPAIHFHAFSVKP
ncbi:MAG: hypothetical protein ACR2IB_07390 [Pyrinomonadaceae bacterium]